MLLLHKPTWDSLHKYEKRHKFSQNIQKNPGLLSFMKVLRVQGNRDQLFDLVLLSTHESHYVLTELFCEVELSNQGHCLVSYSTQIEEKSLGQPSCFYSSSFGNFPEGRCRTRLYNITEHALTGWITPAWKISMSFNRAVKSCSQYFTTSKGGTWSPHSLHKWKSVLCPVHVIFMPSSAAQ